MKNGFVINYLLLADCFQIKSPHTMKSFYFDKTDELQCLETRKRLVNGVGFLFL